MALKIIQAKNKKDMENIQNKLAENKFKVQSSEKNYILMKKKRYGNTVIQLGILFFALFVAYPIIIINVVYFSYSYLVRSPTVLITTETKSTDGENLEFSSLEEVIEQGNAIL